jgi:hypothetical protein
MTGDGLGDMRPSYGLVIRAVAAVEPTINRLAELLGVTKQAASKLAEETSTTYWRVAQSHCGGERGSLRSRTGRIRAPRETHACIADVSCAGPLSAAGGEKDEPS